MKSVSSKVVAVFAILLATTLTLAAITLWHTLASERNFARSQEVQQLLAYLATLQALTPQSLATDPNGPNAHDTLWSAVDGSFARVQSFWPIVSPSRRQEFGRFHDRLMHHRQAFIETVSAHLSDAEYARNELLQPLPAGLASAPDVQRIEQMLAQLARFYLTRDLAVIEPLRARLEQIRDQALREAVRARLLAAEDNHLSYLGIREREAFLGDTLMWLVALGEDLLAELEAEGRRVDRWLFTAMVAVLLFYFATVLFVGLGAKRYVQRFLAAQTHAMAEIERGRYDYEPHPFADDDLGRLGKFIKQVAGGLGESKALTEKSLNRLRVASETTGLGIWELDIVHDRLEWDERMYAIYGRDPHNPVRSYVDWSDAVAPEDREAAEGAVRRALEHTGQFFARFRVRDTSGAVRHVEGHGLVERDDRGQPISIIGSNLDVTDRVRSNERLRLMARVFASAREAILITDRRGRAFDLNPTFSELTGWTRKQMIGQSALKLRSERHPLFFYRDLIQAVSDDGYWRGEVWIARSDGGAFPALAVVSEVQDDDGLVTHYVALIDNIASIKEQQHRLEHLAHHDALTQLPNRVLFADRLEQGMARVSRGASMVAVGYLDLDEFKLVNDQLGHKAGDRLLINVARRLRGTLRSLDTVARLGGDEFALLLNDVDGAQGCRESLSRLLSDLARPFALGDGLPLRISASIGVVLYEGGSTTADELVRRADQAMYRAKELGRNRIEFFHGRVSKLSADRENTLTRIERALAAGELALYYQPRVDMKRGSVVGVEALIRWIHPVRGLVLPGEFLPVVEGTEFVKPLGDWVTDTALTQLEAWRANGLDLAVSVNISPDHLKAPGFAVRLAEHLDHHPTVPPECLELEILESTALDDLGQIGSVITDCRALGVRIALDDFGTGYSSLAYLKGMPADILKIDQSFVRDLLVDRDDFALVAAVIGLGKSFQKQVVAEGVETPDHGELLLRMGCNLAQGFGIARPMPAGQLAQWVERFSNDSRWQIEPVGDLDRDPSPVLCADLGKR